MKILPWTDYTFLVSTGGSRPTVSGALRKLVAKM